MDEFQKRIEYQGDIAPVLSDVCKKYDIGEYKSHEVIKVGYEDLNLIVETSHHSSSLKSLRRLEALLL